MEAGRSRGRPGCRLTGQTQAWQDTRSSALLCQEPAWLQAACTGSPGLCSPCLLVHLSGWHVSEHVYVPGSIPGVWPSGKSHVVSCLHGKRPRLSLANWRGQGNCQKWPCPCRCKLCHLHAAKALLSRMGCGELSRLKAWWLRMHFIRDTVFYCRALRGSGATLSFCYFNNLASAAFSGFWCNTRSHQICILQDHLYK